MDSKNLEMLLKEANKYLKKPDVIIDPFDMTFVWSNDKSIKHFEDGLVGERVAKTAEDPSGIEDFRKMSAEASTVDYKIKNKEILLHLGPNIKKKTRIKYVTIEFNNQPYLVSKIDKFLE